MTGTGKTIRSFSRRVKPNLEAMRRMQQASGHMQLWNTDSENQANRLPGEGWRYGVRFTEAVLEAEHEAEVDTVDQYYSSEEKNPDLDIVYDSDFF